MTTMNELARKALEEHAAPRVAEQAKEALREKQANVAANARSACGVSFDKYGEVKSEGLTKREHFAGLAMQGLLSSAHMGDSDLHDSAAEWVREVTETSVEYADALLKELEK